MLFIVIAAVMVLVAVGVFVPLVWRRRANAHESANAELAAHKRALEKLDMELAKGRLSMPEYLTARTALERAFQTRLSQFGSQPTVVPAPKPRWIIAIIASFTLIVVVAGLYVSIGNWHAAFGGNRVAANDTEQQMVTELAHRLATTDSGDANGWMMLGRSYVVLGRYTEAVPAYAHAYALMGDGNPDLLADYAEAIILADPSKLTTTAAPLLDKALHAAPDNPKALWYAGLLALADHNRALAIQRWQKLLGQDPPQGIRQLVVQHIKDLGGTITSATSAKAAYKFVIPVHVTIAPRFAKRVSSGTTLFVFVRPAGSDSGPPLLATRVQVGKLPTDLQLTEANAMMPGTSLSAYSEVDVTARLSLKGDATVEAGDMEGDTLFKFAPKLHVATITINRIVP